MIAFCVRRLLWMAATLWVVFTVTFFLVRAVPGGPFDAEREQPEEVRANLRAKYNLDAPLHEQYLTTLWEMAHGDLGYSMKMDISVNEIVADGFPVSASLGLLALTFAILLGLTTGVVSALFRGSAGDVLLRLAATVGIALPNFVIAGVAIIVFVFWIPLLPAAGWGSPRQMILPAFCLGAPYAAYVARISRTSMLDVLSQDHIRTAKAKGVGPVRVALVHALRGALLPVVSFIGPAIAGILTGSLVVEKLFAVPGIGTYFVDAALQRDLTLSMGVVMLYTLLLYSMNFLVDLSYAVLDPRVKLE
ncbi:MAG: ABC transporter permease [Planctomycetales bacterium]|nr:ABC transporter permease [Planctomycetales bacterium]